MLHVEHVTKRYGEVWAVDAVSLSLQRGEIFALLGPNGAGKTTLVRMLVGLALPDAGTIRWAHTGSAARPALGYLPEDRGLYRDRKVLDILVFFGRLYGMSRGQARDRAMHWLERLELDDRKSSKLSELSKGNQQKVQLIAALLHQPELLVLDEPFSGLDPVNQERVVQLVQDLRRQGTTVLLSAHQMDLVQRLADRITLLSAGRVVLQGTLSELRAAAGGGERHLLRFTTTAPLKTLKAHPAIVHVHPCEDDHEALVELGPSRRLGEVLADLPQLGELHAVQPQVPDLHEIYVNAVTSRHTGSVTPLRAHQEAA